MKLGISNIAWKKENDIKIYNLMKQQGYCGLEIAPTRIFLENPYDKLDQCQKWRDELYREYHFEVPSIQSIWLVWDAEFNREKIGEMPTEMFLHFFKSLSDAAKMNLNIKAEGQNEHHKIEGIFKALARALKMALKRDIYHFELPSSKGVL